MKWRIRIATLIIITLVVGVTSLAFAQEEPEALEVVKELRELRRDIGLLEVINKLNLTPEQMDKMISTLQLFQDLRENMKREREAGAEEIKGILQAQKDMLLRGEEPDPDLKEGIEEINREHQEIERQTRLDLRRLEINIEEILTLEQIKTLEEIARKRVRPEIKAFPILREIGKVVEGIKEASPEVLEKMFQEKVVPMLEKLPEERREQVEKRLREGVERLRSVPPEKFEKGKREIKERISKPPQPPARLPAAKGLRPEISLKERIMSILLNPRFLELLKEKRGYM